MKRTLSVILILGVLLSLMSGVAYAAPQTIDEVVIEGFPAPQVGMVVEDVSSDILTVPQGAEYSLPSQIAKWKDGKDQFIYPGDYTFEAGGTYKLSLSIDRRPSSKTFSDKTKVVLKDVPAGSYTVEVEPQVSNTFLYVTLTFVMPGTYAPKPIGEINLVGGQIKDGALADYDPTMLYNHGYVGGAMWEGTLTSDGAFIGGNTYSLVMNIKDYAKVGFAPVEDISVTYNGAKLNAVLEIMDKGETLHISAKVTVPAITTVSSVLTYGFSNRYPIAGANAKSYDPGVELTCPTGKGYSMTEVSAWVRTSDRQVLSEEETFVLGQKYYLDISYRLTDPDNFKFSTAPSFTLHGVEEEWYSVSIACQDKREITVRYTFTPQKPPVEIISQVNVWDIDTPRPEVKADYGALIYDGGYRVSKIEWYNKTGQHYLYIPNHDHYQGNQYQVEVYLEALEGYEFASAQNLKCYINGEPASAVSRTSDTTCRVEYHFPACEKGKINDVAVWGIAPPETGVEGDYTGKTGEGYYLYKNGSYFSNGIGWWDLTTATYLMPGETFLGGHQYMAELYLSPKHGNEFDHITATVNGQTPDDIFISNGQAVLYVEFPTCKIDGNYTVNQIGLTGVTVPLAGGTPAYSAGIAGDGYKLSDKTEGNYLNGICWYDKTTGQEISPSTPFQAGHEYQIICSLDTLSGYAFGANPGATVNGAVVDAVIPSGNTCTVICSLGLCKPVGKEITKVDYVSVDAPAAGKLPDYFVAAAGQGYSNKNWNDQYMKNGILWHDITARKNITPDTPFQEGHQYQVYILTVAESGYYFAQDVSGTINGNAVEIFDENGEKNLCHTFPPIPTSGSTSNPFKDVPENAWYTDAVLWAVDKGITNGYGSADRFAPDVTCSRSQVVTFLWRAAGSPKPSTTKIPFKDVPENAWYTDAVLWAVEKGITTGTGDGSTFSPDMECTRAQVVTFLQRFRKEKPTSTTNPFKDVPEKAWYTDAVLWASEKKITTGTGDGSTFSPDMKCSRSQIVTFLYRCMNLK